MEQITPEQQQLLMASPEARSNRQAEKLGKRAVDFSRGMRGRKRPELPQTEQLFPLADTIADDRVTRLGQKLRGQQPLFDQFTNHHKVKPTRDSIEQYCMGGNKRNRRWSDDPAERQEIRKAMRRQTQNIADGLEQGMFDDLNIARLRRKSVKVTRYLIGHNLPLDKQAAIHAADAIEDFGYCLLEQPKLLSELQEPDLAANIAHIGKRAAEDPEIMRQNPLLLRLVQIEQKARDDFWSERYPIVEHVLGDRLTLADKANGEWVEVEIARLDQILQS
jgi:hypothetical protein